MHEIELDGRGVWYYPQGEQVPPEVTERVARYRFRNDAMTMHHPRLRQIVVPSGRETLFMRVLHWDDGTDLHLLDHLLARGAEVDTALDRALAGEVQEPKCQSCNNPSLVVVAGEGPGASLPRQRAHRLDTTCPNCGDTGYIGHLEVLE